MKQQKGFTLIELVVVIVILGILAAVAVPRFANLQDDARQGAIESALGSVKSAAAIVHAKALVAGETGGTISLQNLVDTSDDVVIVNGYPSDSPAGIVAAVDLEQVVAARNGDDDTMIFRLDNLCFTYTEPATNGETPDISGVQTYDSTNNECP